MSMKRVAIFLPSLRGGGAERVMLDLAKNFAGRGIAVDLVLQRVEGPFLSQVPKTVRIIDLKTRRMAFVLFPLISYLRRERPQAILSAMMHTNIMAILSGKLAKVNTRVVISEHNTLSVSLQNDRNVRGRFLPFLAQRIYPWAGGIVAVSGGVANDLARTLGLSRERIKVIYNAVVIPEILEKAKEPVEHPWFQAGELPVVLAVGRLTKQKDFPTLLRAVALVRKRHPARLVILGEGEERAELEKLAKELGISQEVDMPGFMENPCKYMLRAAVFVLSSAWEGFGIVLVEAMAVGTPVVSTDCLSGPREILCDGKYGKLARVNDPQDLASAIIETLANPIKESVLKEQARTFRVDYVAQQYLDMLLQKE